MPLEPTALHSGACTDHPVASFAARLALQQVIANSFSDARQLEGASLVCKGWRNGFASGMPGIELTVHRDEQQWCVCDLASRRQFLFSRDCCDSQAVGAGRGLSLRPYVAWGYVGRSPWGMGQSRCLTGAVLGFGVQG